MKNTRSTFGIQAVDIFTTIVFCAALGVLWKMGNTGYLIYKHNYPTIGFWINSLATLRGETLVGAMIGGLFGLLFAALKPLHLDTRSISFLGKIWPVGLVTGLGVVVAMFRFFALHNLQISIVQLLIVSELSIGFFYMAALFACGKFKKRKMQLLLWIGHPASNFFVLVLLLVLPFFKANQITETLHQAVVTLPLMGLFCLGFMFVRIHSKPESPPFAVRLISIVLVLTPAVSGFVLPFATNAKMTPEKPMNVVVIAIDTLRSDHTSIPHLSDGQRDTTPHLRKLSERGLIFTSAISQAPWTLPAFASILTGKYPADHGALDFPDNLRDAETTIAEIMREAGYATGGIVSNYFLNVRHGYNQGFSHFNDSFDEGHHAVTSHKVTADGLNFLAEHKENNFFLFLHYFDPHYEYRDHEQFGYADKYSGWLKDETLEIHRLRKKAKRMSVFDIGYLKDLYDEEIAYTDKQIGKVLEFLDTSGLNENTAIILVVDHGEEFLERGWLGHTVSLHHELVKVPLVLVLPGERHGGRAIGDTVETRSVFNTVLNMVGIPYDLDEPARDLNEVAAHNTNGISYNDYAYSNVWITKAPKTRKLVKLASIQNNDWKLIWDQQTDKMKLFDLNGDPGEWHDVKDSQSDTFNKMQLSLTKWWSKSPDIIEQKNKKTLSDDEKARLRALGYM